MKNILISTGGSGGHVVPAKILSEHLHSNFNVFISTDSRGLKYIDGEKNDIILINTPKLNLNIFFIFIGPFPKDANNKTLLVILFDDGILNSNLSLLIFL